VPVRVQGEGAAQEIAEAIRLVNRFPEPVDCIVVTRGGGSLEDLWAFNEEPVVRVIAASKVVVVSAVGHEIDVTLADLAADVRAATPSEAAELVVPATEEMLEALRQVERRMAGALAARASSARARLDALAVSRVFRRPLERVHDLARRLDEWESRGGRAMVHRLDVARHRVEAISARLDSLSPLAVLARGYSLTEHVADGRLVRDASTLVVGEQLRTRFAQGRTISRVEQIDD
jgi:exodeoxyribonuclease VII large subunit